MAVEGTSIDGVVNAEIIAVQEELTGKTVEEFQGQIRACLEKGRTQFILDCKALKQLSSAGLEALLQALVEAQALGGTIKIAALGKTPRKVFEITQFHRIFDLYDDVIAALKNL